MKLRFLAGIATGYVLGTRAGRESYDRLVKAVGDSELFAQARDELSKLRGSGTTTPSQPSGSTGGPGMVTPPVIVGPGPEGTAGTDAQRLDMAGDVVLPDLEPSTSAQDVGDADESQRAKRITPPNAS